MSSKDPRKKKPAAMPPPPEQNLHNGTANGDAHPAGHATDAGRESPVPIAVGPGVDEQSLRDGVDRGVQPVDHESPPRLAFPVVGIGASAGGLEAMIEFVTSLPAHTGMAFVLVQHLPPDRESLVAEILAKRCPFAVLQVEDGMALEVDHLYVIRPGHTLTIQDGRLHLGHRLEKPMHNRPVDDFFKSLAEEQQERAIAIIMSGMGSNGSAGAQAIKAVGGLCIAQNPESAQYPSMPRHLVKAGYADYVLTAREMPDVLMAYAGHSYARDRRAVAEQSLQREAQYLREVMALLRTRTRHDFSGYKKPTVLRRIQRRMGLNRVEKLAEYAVLLRGSASEVAALADDLLIHVTGFFRDPDAWETLRERVIVPLVASREAGSSVRAWVTACASGEEAYSLAMLLVEEADRSGKNLDIKVFATDLADRTLANARQGEYPGGIEAEIAPQRLERFFHKEDSQYRVRAELRQMVVFAPQNVLQDPPFSRLDIVSCRNLLIYLEPEVQQRLLGMLHFGLREGGALFLGSSETLGSSEELFQTIDKPARIFRRVGVARQPGFDFTGAAGLTTGRSLEALARPRLSVAQMSTRTLLEKHTPPAVTVDRDFRIVYFHGDTSPFLNQPRGEPTRDLLVVAREQVRGAVRTAVQQALSENKPATVIDGWIETERGRERLVVLASPMSAKDEPEYVVVSFQLAGPVAPATPPSGTVSEPEGDLRRVYHELQSTVEELQSSNEELKAAHEELVSTNEELQSTNEELETSREEMQSLNEELSTVNAQLQSKIDEHQAVSNDLSSLLTSTDLAVLFLDTLQRIRRFTPPVRDLIDVVASDLGRPLSDLARKFDDPALLTDAQQVLERLTPVEHEVPAKNGRWFLRRITPYRTIDNRIDGVVITFHDITDRRAAVQMLERSEASLTMELKALHALHALTLRLQTAATVPAAMDEVLTAAMDLQGADMGMVQLFDPERRTLAAVVHRGFDQAFVQQFATCAAEGDSPVAGVAASGEVRVAADIAADSGADRQAAEAGRYKAVHRVPLLDPAGKPLGVLSVYFRQPQALTAAGRVAIELIARHAVETVLRLRAQEIGRSQLQSEQSARHAMDEAVRVKDAFLATLSHELRTPLTAISGWSKMLRDKALAPETVREGLEAISKSGSALSHLVDDLVDASRISAGKMRLEMTTTDLSAVIRSAYEIVRPTADAKGVHLEVPAPATPIFVWGDAHRLQQVMWNLMVNAVKFTPAKGRVRVSQSSGTDGVEVRITDTGAGIDPTFLPVLFDRFRQFESTRTRRSTGLGLGLSISKQLVELHGGSISAESAGLGKGATFIVRLPQRQQKEGGAAWASEPKDGHASLEGVRVLLVEDDEGGRRASQVVMEQAGAKVVAVASASAAFAVFTKDRPHVIVSDIGLPDQDGHELLARVREWEGKQGLAPTPAIALTAYARPQDREASLAAGFQCHLPKPVDFAGLINTILAAVPTTRGAAAASGDDRKAHIAAPKR